MLKTKFFTILSFLFLIGSVSAQNLALPSLQGFKKIENYPVFTPETLWDFINGAADTYLAYGFQNLHVAEYKKGKNIIKLEVYKLSNNIMAFGIYSSERSPSFQFVNIGAQGYKIDGTINFFKGDYYIKIRTFSKKEKILKATESLAHIVAEQLDGTVELPSTLAMFPVAGKKVNEETYINESVLGHKFLTNSFKANYTAGTDDFSVFIINEATPAELNKTVNDYLTSAAMDAVDSESGRYMLKDGYNGTIFLAWKNKTIVIISGLSQDQSDIADRYTSDILK